MKPLLSSLMLFLLPLSAIAEPIGIMVTGGKTDQTNVVCTVALPPGVTTNVTALKLPDGGIIPAQTVGPAVLDNQDKQRRIVFVLPKLKAGEKLSLEQAVLPPASKPQPKFVFVEEKGKYSDLLLGSQPVLRYINAPHDPANHFLTFKPSRARYRRSALLHS